MRAPNQNRNKGRFLSVCVCTEEGICVVGVVGECQGGEGGERSGDKKSREGKKQIPASE
jgi:hypothetical protein